MSTAHQYRSAVLKTYARRLGTTGADHYGPWARIGYKSSPSFSSDVPRFYNDRPSRRRQSPPQSVPTPTPYMRTYTPPERERTRLKASPSLRRMPTASRLFSWEPLLCLLLQCHNTIKKHQPQTAGFPWMCVGERWQNSPEQLCGEGEMVPVRRASGRKRSGSMRVLRLLPFTS
jgi:hypothetical protein